jgi:CSLREA domain-containing protein
MIEIADFSKLLSGSIKNRAIFTVFAVFIFLTIAQNTSAATFTVTRSDDRNTVCVSGVDCSLREAINAADSAPTDDTINFAANLTKITLTNEILITSQGTLTITGNGAKNFAIDGGPGTNRIFSIANSTFTITDVTLTGGNGGGASHLNYAGAIDVVAGSVTLDRVHVFKNSVSNNVAGVYFDSGTHFVRNSTFSENTAAGCSALASTSNNTVNLTVVNSTFSGNIGTSFGGAGGAMCINGNVTLRSVTITRNRTANVGGGFNFGFGTLSMSNSIVAGNTALENPEINNQGNAITSGGFNLIGDSSGDSSNTNHPVVYQGSDLLDTPPRLLPLKTYGGSTPTNALSMLSPAIDKGLNLVEVVDQRGKTRPFDFTFRQNAPGGNGTDIGAFERQLADNPLDVIFDFDNDTKTDLSIFRPSLGEWWYLRSSDGQNRAFQFGSGSDKIAPADFTGDGKTDVAFFRPSTGEWFVLRSEDNSFYSFPFGLAQDIPVPADYDGDGKADAAIFRPSSAVWYISQSSGGVVNFTFGQNGDFPAVAHYDEDGKADVAIYRPSLGEWWIQRSSAGLIAFQFGNSSDKPVPGDYTGDGNADAAFWRPSTGEWFVLRSEDLSYYSFPFGISTDIPAPGEYDGDGKFDAAVFRPSNTTWFVQQTTAGTLIQTFGQTGDVPVPSAFIR